MNASINNAASTITNNSTFGAPLNIATAQEFIAQGEAKLHFPTDVRQCSLTVNDDKGGLKAPKASAIVCEYADGSRVVAGINGRRYNPTTPQQWRDLITAAVTAGGRPMGSHSWDGKVIAQFEVETKAGIRTTLVLGDSFDGSTNLVAGSCSTRLACANQLAGRINGKKAMNGIVKISHTASLDVKIKQLEASIALAVAAGEEVRDLFARVSQVHLPVHAAEMAFNALFPLAAKDAGNRATTIANNAREDALKVAGLACNRVGGRGNLATLWNAATYLVDRRADGSARPARGESSRVDSMVFGTRGKRVGDVRQLIEVMMADGRLEEMTIGQATSAGVDKQQIGASLLADMIADADK